MKPTPKTGRGHSKNAGKKPAAKITAKTQATKTQTPVQKAKRPALKVSPQMYKLTQAWMQTINDLGRLPRGSTDNKLKGTELTKALFRVNKKNIHELWEVYTQRRDELSRKLMNNQAYTISYLLGFHLANTARALDLLTRSNIRHFWNKLCASAPVQLYDIGCGTGAMSAAFLQSAKASSTTLYDASGPLLDAAKVLHAHLGTKNLRTSRRVIEELDLKWFRSEDPQTVHVYTLGYVWNELHRNNPARRRLMEIFAQHLQRNERCLIFIAEPALEHMSRPAMELRDVLCSAGYQALYPCPHSDACPMLERPKDWCYSEGLWEQPELAAWIDEKLELDRRKHAATMFAFASPATKLASDQNPVVVGRPVRSEGVERYKGFFDYLVCSAEGIEKHEPQTPKDPILRGQKYVKI